MALEAPGDQGRLVDRRRLPFRDAVDRYFWNQYRNGRWRCRTRLSHRYTARSMAACPSRGACRRPRSLPLASSSALKPRSKPEAMGPHSASACMGISRIGTYISDQTANYLDIRTRVEILNQRLNVIHDLFEMLGTELNHSHSNRLEWTIIWLILIEVIISLTVHVFHIL